MFTQSEFNLTQFDSQNQFCDLKKCSYYLFQLQGEGKENAVHLSAGLLFKAQR